MVGPVVGHSCAALLRAGKPGCPLSTHEWAAASTKGPGAPRLGRRQAPPAGHPCPEPRALPLGVLAGGGDRRIGGLIERQLPVQMGRQLGRADRLRGRSAAVPARRGWPRPPPARRPPASRGTAPRSGRPASRARPRSAAAGPRPAAAAAPRWRPATRPARARWRCSTSQARRTRTGLRIDAGGGFGSRARPAARQRHRQPGALRPRRGFRAGTGGISASPSVRARK
jgi:hypothetical protein